jgi:hypothetical protein
VDQVASAQAEDHDIHGRKRRTECAIAHLKQSAEGGTIEKGTGRLRKVSLEDCDSILKFTDVLIGQNICDGRVAKYIISL